MIIDLQCGFKFLETEAKQLILISSFIFTSLTTLNLPGQTSADWACTFPFL